MDLLECQRIRKLTTLYHQLKTPGTKIDRIEFVGELHTVLMEEPHSIILEEVNKIAESQFSIVEIKWTKYFEFYSQLLDLLRREHKLLLANVDKDTIATLRRRQTELFRNFIISHKMFKPTNKSSD